MTNNHKKKSKIDFLLVFWFSLLGVLTLGCILLVVWIGPSELVAAINQAGEESGGSAGENIIQVVGEKIEKVEEKLKEEDNSRYGAVLKDTEKMAENHIYAKEAADPDKITMAFAGDILFDKQYAVMSTIERSGNGIKSAFSAPLWEEMQAADIFMLNNEFPYTERGTPLEGKLYTFRAVPETASYLQEMGVDIVTLANNHASDFGEVSLLDSLDTLDALGMPHVGAGRNLEEASHPAYFIINDTKIAVVSATQIERLDIPDTKGATAVTPGVFRCWDPTKLLEVIGEAKQNSDFVVVYVHWGTENDAAPDWAQLDQVGKIADAGADLIIGDHPHVLQQIDIVDGVPVIYSLGNYLFNSKKVDTCLVKVEIANDKLQSFQFVPVLQEGCHATLLDGFEKERVLSYMQQISTNVTIDADGYLQLP
ncbi:MAG: CapA family protein [Lachnospiraceae bacterium]|nr:CapA family protein [Lachnospiraceae bacterium]